MVWIITCLPVLLLMHIIWGSLDKADMNITVQVFLWPFSHFSCWNYWDVELIYFYKKLSEQFSNVWKLKLLQILKTLGIFCLCISYLFLYKQLSKTLKKNKKTQSQAISYKASETQESRSDLAGWFWFKTSHEVVIKLLNRVLVLWRCWTSHSQAHHYIGRNLHFLHRWPLHGDGEVEWKERYKEREGEEESTWDRSHRLL